MMIDSLINQITFSIYNFLWANNNQKITLLVSWEKLRKLKKCEFWL